MQSLADFSRQLGSAAAFARMLSFARAEGAMDAFSASGTPAVMLDRNATVILVNEPAERLFGRDLWVTGRLVPTRTPPMPSSAHFMCCCEIRPRRQWRTPSRCPASEADLC
jgi:hypothetical protein